MLLGLVFKTNNLLPGFTLLCISSRSHLLSWLPIRNTESAAWLIACSTLNNHRWKHAGPGPWLLCSLASCLGLGDILSVCSSDGNSCAAQFFTWPVISLYCLAYCPVLIALGRSVQSLAQLNRGPLRSTSLEYPQDWAGAGTFEPSCPIMKPAPKRSAHLAVIAKPTRVTCRDLACQE